MNPVPSRIEVVSEPQVSCEGASRPTTAGDCGLHIVPVRERVPLLADMNAAPEWVGMILLPDARWSVPANPTITERQFPHCC